MAAENILLLNASAIRCSPSPPTKILTFKASGEAGDFFYGIEAQSILGSKAIAALFAPWPITFKSCLATTNPSALLSVQSLESRSVICR